MLGLFKDGYLRDYIILITITLFLGGVIAWGVAIVVDAFFGDTVRELIGDVGDYDVLIQVREERGQVATEDLERVVFANFPEARLDKGVSLVGKLHYFLKLPPQYQNTETFESLHTIFQQVPGYTGLTFLIEPSLVVSGVHPSIHQTLATYIKRLSGVSFTINNNNSLIVVVNSPGRLGEVTNAIEKFFAQNKIAEVRLPLGVSVNNQQDAPELVEEALRSVLGEDDFSSNLVEVDAGESEGYVQTLTEMRELLLSFATKVIVPVGPDMIGIQVLLSSPEIGPENSVVVRLEEEVQGQEPDQNQGVLGYVVKGELPKGVTAWPSYVLLPTGEVGDYLGSAHLYSDRNGLFQSIDESVRLLGELEVFAAEAQGSIQEAQELLNSLNQALAKMDSLSQNLSLLQESIASLGGESSAKLGNILLTVLLSNIIKNNTPSGELKLMDQIEENLAKIDVRAFQESLTTLASRVGEMAELNVEAVIDQIEQVRKTLPSLNDSEIYDAVRLIDENLGNNGVKGDRITFVSPGDIPLASVENAIEDALGLPGVELLLTESGTVTPSARGTLMQILGEVRRFIAGILSIIIVLLTLVLDHSVLLSWAQEETAHSPTSQWWNKPSILGGMVGGTLLAGISLLSGGVIPYLGLKGMALIGVGIGLLICVLAEKISPVDMQEIEAGMALGLTKAQIIREIIIPRGRPGILSTINRWQQVFR